MHEDTDGLPIISKSAARRYLLRRVGLTADAPWRSSLRGLTGTLTALRRLENVQIDPVNVLARNQMLAMGQRVARPGSGLDGLLAQGKVFEYACGARFAYPIEDYPYFRVRMRQRAAHWEERLRSVQSAAESVLQRLANEGPLPSRALDSGERVQGWWDNAAVTKATRHALDLLEDAGKVTTVRREGQERYFALPEQVYPPELLAAGERISPAEWRDFIVAKYFRGHGLAHPSDFRFGWIGIKAPERRLLLADWCKKGKLQAFRIDGVKRIYYAPAEDAGVILAEPEQAGGELDGPVFIIPPLDNLLFQRDRLSDLFEFAYTWEVYVPPAKRRFGPYTMPLLAGERLVGRVDVRYDRGPGALVVNILEFEPWLKPGRRLKSAVRSAIERLAGNLGAQSVRTGNPARVLIDFDRL